MYAIFRLPPFGTPKLRAVKKEQKHYHFDWTLKWTHFQQDSEGRNVELRYFRDIDGREVDFIVTDGRKPVRAIECKLSDEPISKALRYFKQRFPDCDAWQIALEGKKDYVSSDEIRAAPALTLLRELV